MGIHKKFEILSVSLSIQFSEGSIISDTYYDQ